MSGAPQTVLVLGGARSGKSRFAEEIVLGAGPSPVYLATGRALDGEMEARIAEHRSRRGPQWTTLEEPLELAVALEGLSGTDRAVLVDCLTLWLTNVMLDGRDVDAEGERLCRAIAAHEGPLALVSNEVGMGIVPENEMARAFRDHAGRLNQHVARVADTVWFMAAGLPLMMKGKDR